MLVHIDGQNRDLPAGLTCGEALRQALSAKKFKSVVAARCRIAPVEEESCAGEALLLDLSAHIPASCAVLEPVYADSPEGLQIIRHSAAHLMAAAVQRLFPEVKVTIGPAIADGFYYDFDAAKPFSIADFPAIEAEMDKIVSSNAPFLREEMAKGDARDLFASRGESYKLELLDAIPADQVSIYRCADFTDLCRGPHVPHSGFLKAVKLMNVAGAYWHGDEKNPMLSRIYGTAFADKPALDHYLHILEEAKKRDHRKLGKELDFFAFHEDVTPGMVFWLPKGMLVRTILEDFWRKEHLKRGYEIVQGPQLLRAETWQRSGHYDHYRENMYFTEIENDVYGIKPMNCIGHMLIYKHNMRSYRDLPQRYFELGLVHRHEKSGVLHGLLRVRQFTQDDAHILCTPGQLEDEILDVICLIRALMQLFDFEYKVAVSTRPESSIGTDQDWDLATKALIQAVEKAGLPYEINAGDGAFYGPKIDVRLLDSLGREWQCSTIQVDFTLPERFALEYVGQDGERHRPVMVHRAIMGSVERFIGVLIEHYAGALPCWLAPEQARILTVSDAVAEAAQKMRAQLLSLGIRCGEDLRNEKLGYKVREAQLAKVPYILVVGEQEVESASVNVRLRGGKSLGLKKIPELAALIREDSQKPFKQGGMAYSFA